MNSAMKNTPNRKSAMSVIKDGVTLIDFNTNWCVPCREQRPIVEKLEEKYRDRAIVLELNVDEHPEPAIKLGITSIPTLIVFKNGNEFQRFIGIQAEDTLIRSLEAALNS